MSECECERKVGLYADVQGRNESVVDVSAGRPVLGFLTQPTAAAGDGGGGGLVCGSEIACVSERERAIEEQV